MRNFLFQGLRFQVPAIGMNLEWNFFESPSWNPLPMPRSACWKPLWWSDPGESEGDFNREHEGEEIWEFKECLQQWELTLGIRHITCTPVLLENNNGMIPACACYIILQSKDDITCPSEANIYIRPSQVSSTLSITAFLALCFSTLVKHRFQDKSFYGAVNGRKRPKQLPN